MKHISQSENGIKNVATLYRVSTKGQMDGDDIPMQRRACKEFIDKNPNWKLVKEYTEKGISGFKVAASKRDIIQQAKEDAENGVFDILLVFMFDRLGRKDDETPFVLEWFVSMGIEMWSVIEGQQKIEQHADRLINYIRFWQSSGESRKTSERVNEKHKQMVKDGIFRGGGIPYGYSAIESGETNKKGKRLLKLIINEDESKIIKEIFRLVYEEGYGQLRIARHLNLNMKILTRNNLPWSASTVNAILKNSIYKGVMRYRKEKESIFSDEIPSLKIINTDVWNYVQKMREGKSYGSLANNIKTPISTKGKLLLIGMIRCGNCGSRLGSTTFRNKYKSKSGKIKKYGLTLNYRCIGKLQGKEKCNGQSTYSALKIENLVLEYINEVLDRLERIDFTSEINKMKRNNSNDNRNKLKNIQKKIEIEMEELQVLNTEVPKAIMGKSSFKPDLLNGLIESKTIEIKKLTETLNFLKENIDAYNAEIEEVDKFRTNIPIWREVFNGISTERKKVELSKIIDNITVDRDNIEINFNIYIKEIIKKFTLLN